MKTNIVIGFLLPIPYRTKCWFSSYGPKYYLAIKLQDFLKLLNQKKYIFGMQINIKVFWKFILIILSMHNQACPNYLNLKNCIYLQYLQKTWRMKLIFRLQINMKAFYKLMVTFWVFVTRQIQIYQNNKFTISFQYLRENMKEEVDFLQIGKH